MGVQDVGIRAKFLIRDRAAEYPALIDKILADRTRVALVDGELLSV